MSLIAVFLTILQISVHSKTKRGKVSIGWMLLTGIWGGLYAVLILGFEVETLRINPVIVFTQAITIWAFFFGLYYLFSGRKKPTSTETAQSPLLHESSDERLRIPALVKRVAGVLLSVVGGLAVLLAICMIVVESHLYFLNGSYNGLVLAFGILLIWASSGLGRWEVEEVFGVVSTLVGCAILLIGMADLWSATLVTTLPTTDVGAMLMASGLRDQALVRATAIGEPINDIEAFGLSLGFSLVAIALALIAFGAGLTVKR